MVTYLTGTNRMIRGGRGQGYTRARCEQLLAAGQGAENLQENYERSGGYRVPGGVLVGRIGNRVMSPARAYDQGGQVWFLTSPDPEGRTSTNNYCVLGREYKLTSGAARLLKEASRAQGSYGGHPSARLWLEKAFGPKLLLETESSVQREETGRQRITSSHRTTKQRVADEEEQRSRGPALGFGGLPWLPIAVVGAGVYLYTRR
jgi:hypothetical protein